MGGEHDTSGQFAGLQSPDNIACGMKTPSCVVPTLLLFGHLVAQAVTVAVPATACVGEIQYLTEIDIVVWLANELQVFVTIFIPQGAAVVFGHRCAVHGTRAYGIELAEIVQSVAEVLVCFGVIAVAERHILVVVTDLVSQLCYQLDAIGIIALAAYAEII